MHVEKRRLQVFAVRLGQQSRVGIEDVDPDPAARPQVAADVGQQAILLLQGREVEKRVEQDAGKIELPAKIKVQCVGLDEFQLALAQADGVALATGDLQHVAGIV